jgi:hypothetical protein
MVCINKLEDSLAISGRKIKKKTLNIKLIKTFEILITAYFIGRPSALILEKGIIAKASKAKIQMAKTTYSTLIFDQSAKFFRNKINNTKNPIVDQKREMVDVETTFLLSLSEL